MLITHPTPPPNPLHSSTFVSYSYTMYNKNLYILSKIPCGADVLKQPVLYVWTVPFSLFFLMPTY